MAAITIYHNGQCSKSKGALELLQDAGVEFNVRWYLSDPLQTEELAILLKKADMKPSALVRKSEPIYKERYEGMELSETEWLNILVAEPLLMERPIVEKGDKAIVARPAELVIDFINKH